MVICIIKIASSKMPFPNWLQSFLQRSSKAVWPSIFYLALAQFLLRQGHSILADSIYNLHKIVASSRWIRKETSGFSIHLVWIVRLDNLLIKKCVMRDLFVRRYHVIWYNVNGVELSWDSSLCSKTRRPREWRPRLVLSTGRLVETLSVVCNINIRRARRNVPS